MIDDDLDPASERITQAIAEAIRAGELGEDSEGMPHQWVLIATHIDSTGSERTAMLTNNGAHTHQTLGLLAMGTVAWQENVRRWVDGQQED